MAFAHKEQESGRITMGSKKFDWLEGFWCESDDKNNEIGCRKKANLQMEKLCNALSEIHLYSVVTLSASTPTVRAVCRRLSREIIAFRFECCWLTSFLEHFPSVEWNENCNFRFISTHRLLLRSCINN